MRAAAPSRPSRRDADALVESIYRAALEPDAWGDVMDGMRRVFPSVAQTFYFLDLEPRRVRPIHLDGVAPRYLASFDSLYFAPDNPWIRLSSRLHRPGVIRTNERLHALLRDRGALYRSAYFNDWMRPQGFRHTLGNTLLAEERMVANITLLRPSDMRTFTSGEVRLFTRLSTHMTRALHVAVRLERAEFDRPPRMVLDGLPHAVAVLDDRRRLVHANSRMEAMLRRRDVLRSDRGSIDLADAEGRRWLAVQSAVAASPLDAASPSAPSFDARRDDGHALRLHAVPIMAGTARLLPPAARLLLVVVDEERGARASVGSLRARFGMTAAEARLAALLAGGSSLRAAADAMGITYGTARGYLKLAFDKAGVHSQGQLVARIV